MVKAWLIWKDNHSDSVKRFNWIGIDQEKAEELLGEYNRMESEKIEREIEKSTGKVS